MAHNILIIGGTGVFGKRLVRHLSRQPDLVLYVSSRSAAQAAAFTKTLPLPQAELRPVKLDTRVNLQEQLDHIRPRIVVDCSGPFQGAGYGTAHAVLEAGAHFIDLADARDYLAGFADALDATARRNGVCALTGASSTPTLSTCVARHLTDGWQRVDTIDIAITPGGKSEVGRSVIEAILSYAGTDVPLWANGKLSKTTGWQNAKTIDVPGLGHRRVAAVETFDAEYLGPRLNVQSRVSFSAGLESGIEQRGIEALAALRKRGIIGALDALIPLLLKARHITRIPTSSSGGMLVDICGLDADGVMTQTRWSMVARQDHGPNIPILPAAAAIRKLLSGPAKPGADFAHAELSLADIQDEMQGYDIKTATSAVQTKQSDFENALGPHGMKALPQ
ncbi:saccharopine dehydrogenase NADP-binding domain-containing protein [uncultured Tateyamaria sp.]|uniref:saccharopine dehydrogenase family protein n=1 Tax=uncultured Tateyamaria sp. TaxID=455651 RepID=UPI0026233D8F|nr:saccharopine dehydrogenase NADP-binding domain-containing protein [uncultured Tateyamaria sp.]